MLLYNIIAFAIASLLFVSAQQDYSCSPERPCKLGCCGKNNVSKAHLTLQNLSHRCRSVAWAPITAQLRTARPAVARRASAIQAGAHNGAPARSALSTSAAPSLASAERLRTSAGARRSRSRAALAGRVLERESSGTMRVGRRPRSAMEVRTAHQASPLVSSTDSPVVIEVL